MIRRSVAIIAAMTMLGFVPAASSLACTTANTDASNPHAFGGSAGFSVGSIVTVGSIDNPPCDTIGSDGDWEVGDDGAAMPIIGATCPYAQDIVNEAAGGGPVTIGHHGDGIWVTNLLGLDVAWVSGVDGHDPAAPGQACTGNGVITDDALTDPADCVASGLNFVTLGLAQHSANPLSARTNDPNSGFTCLDAVDGNEWTAVFAGPFLCNGATGFSWPISGFIWSGVFHDTGPSVSCSPVLFGIVHPK
jgi:hypothetical protein